MPIPTKGVAPADSACPKYSEKKETVPAFAVFHPNKSSFLNLHRKKIPDHPISGGQPVVRDPRSGHPS
ncbi:MAG: hypothetical protein U9P12_09770, partial [Verrucomicrobiota bacterium]|nr:hypothetical protein [Verrucomicrobiota bacterium]